VREKCNHKFSSTRVELVERAGACVAPEDDEGTSWVVVFQVLKCIKQQHIHEVPEPLPQRGVSPRNFLAQRINDNYERLFVDLREVSLQDLKTKLSSPVPEPLALFVFV